MIELRVGDRPALFLALSRDGAVNRSGSGRPNPAEKDVFIGQAPGPFFEQVMELFAPTWLDQASAYTAKQQLGERCVLKLTFFRSDRPPDSPAVLEFSYGSDSGGPPGDIQAFVHRAVQVTQDWYAQMVAQVATSHAQSPEKPWWRFW